MALHAWRCQLCMRTEDSAQAFASTPCLGGHHLLTKVHSTHELYFHEGHTDFYFCGLCAGWTGNCLVKKLAAPCKGLSGGKAWDRAKLLAGYKVLRTGDCTYRGEARRLTPAGHLPRRGEGPGCCSAEAPPGRGLDEGQAEQQLPLLLEPGVA